MLPNNISDKKREETALNNLNPKTVRQRKVLHFLAGHETTLYNDICEFNNRMLHVGDI